MNVLQYCFYFMFWFFGHEACRILAAQPGMEPTPPALWDGVLTTGHQGSPFTTTFLAHHCYLEKRAWDQNNLLSCIWCNSRVEWKHQERHEYKSIAEFCLDFWLCSEISELVPAALCRAWIWLPNNYLQASETVSRKEASSFTAPDKFGMENNAPI